MIWTLTIQTTIKYVTIILGADNKSEGGIFSLFALLRKITNRFLRFMPIEQYIEIIKDLRNDTSVPKTATNIVFNTKANRTTDSESKVIHSFLNKQPKQAVHYRLIHVDILDEPRTLVYKVTQMLPGILT